MSKLMYGSISLSKLNEIAKAGHRAFSKGKDGKIYCNVNVWINDEKDKFENDASVQVSFKDATKEEKVYIGNLKFSEAKEPAPLQQNDAEIPSDEDLPF